MLALIDIGNSNIVLSKYDGVLGQTYRFRTDKTKSVDEYQVLFKDILKDVNEIIVSSVVPELNIMIKNLAQKYYKIVPIFVGPGVKTGVKIKADNPKEVGADLVSGAAGAIHHYASDVIIIDMGTATTFTYVKDRTIVGVSIIAGLFTQKDALVSNASQLSQFEFHTPTSVLGKNTVECLNTGLLYGHALMIQGIVDKIKTEFHTDAPIIITGGSARFIKDLLGSTIIYDDALLLKGLVVIYDKNR
jgi:type III pantothenate kinase